ncbi:uncharacterized protein [Gossypium hirsutum]|uniref:Uncharacterized protein isoform X3 n=1 Tax=Gossypium hirsutum TaxID=3635 RepID=A0ABM3BUP3_GOSHI|nr:uncharacterized protein LOC107930614 isoform X3 [Gossypium hirsutum]
MRKMLQTLKWTVNFGMMSSICISLGVRNREVDKMMISYFSFGNGRGIVLTKVRKVLLLTLYAGGHLSHNVLRNHQVGQDTPLSAIYKVVKTVYASPSRVNFHLDSKKEVETTPAYPDICFAIDDFDSTFDAVVLTETEHCYCVLLNALDGAAFPSEKDTNDSSSSNKVPLRVDTNSMKTKNSKLTLFSGFVSYQMVRDAYDAGSSGFGSLLSMGHSSGKKDRLYMKGPGGRGEVEVAVSGVVDQSKEDSGPFSPIISKKGFGLGSIVRKAASVASVAAKNAYAVASATSSSDEEMIPLKCCLMSITLPWEHIAYDLLFKGSPPVNL